MKSKQKIYSIASIVIMIDLILKFIVSSKLVENDSLKVIPNFFSIYYLKNTGAAFSILQDSTVFLVILSAIILLILNNYIEKEKSLSKMSEISLGMVIGGIFGNMIDRIINHSVTDFISFRIFNYNFPVFNIADIGITVGVFLLLISVLKDYRKEKK
jgi:signal peptidase II